MTQAAAAPPPAMQPAQPAVSATAPSVPGAPAVQSGAPARKVVDTPRVLSRLAVLAVATAILFGLLSGVIQFLSWQSDGRAADETEQLVRVQSIESSLLRADALSTSGFLTAGLESTTHQQEYDDAISDALETIAEAAKAQPADGEALAALNQQVEDYATDVSQATVYNRQGILVGVAYQTAASTQLREQAIPIVDNLIKANSERSTDAIGGQHPVWLLIVGVVALAVLVLVNQRLARLFRRRVNVGIAVAGAIILVTTLVTTVAAFAHAHGNDKTQDGAYADAVAAATARTKANDAKAQESLGLINRGSGSTYEEEWEEKRKAVEATGVTDARSDWDLYVKRHQAVRNLDDGNAWRQAVIKSTTDDPSGTTAPLDDFDKAMRADVARAAAKATSDLDSGRGLALVLALLTALLGVVAAVMVSRGIGERQKEFL